MPSDYGLEDGFPESRDLGRVQEVLHPGETGLESSIWTDVKDSNLVISGFSHLRDALQRCLISLEVGLAIAAPQQQVFGDVRKFRSDQRFTQYPNWFEVKPKREKVC